MEKTEGGLFYHNLTSQGSESPVLGAVLLGDKGVASAASLGDHTALPQSHLREGSVRCSGQCSVAQQPPVSLKSQFHHLR